MHLEQYIIKKQIESTGLNPHNNIHIAPIPSTHINLDQFEHNISIPKLKNEELSITVLDIFKIQTFN